MRPEDFVISSEPTAGGLALDLTVEAIEHVGAETFVYGTRQREEQGVAATPGELPPGEVIVRVPARSGPPSASGSGSPRRATSCTCLPPTAGATGSDLF